MRRSNSSSQIPIPRNLFGRDALNPRGTLKRSQSSSRVPTESSATTAKITRNSSLDRKSNIARNSKITPLNLHIKKSSLPRTTPASTTSQRSASSWVSPGSALKDRRTITKLATDKKWVAEQYSKVQNFIATSNLFDPSIVNKNNIKPPSIKAFIYTTSVLFKHIFGSVNMNNDNYKEVVTNKLKVLQFPGTMANSVLKTVNTTQSWPRVIGMFSFLIDKVNWHRGFENICLDDLEEDDRQKYLLSQNCWNFFIERYMLFNSKSNPENANVQYVKKITNILQVDPEEYKRLEYDVLQKKEYLINQKTDMEYLKNQLQTITSQLNEVNEEVEKITEADVIEEHDIDAELSDLQKNINKLRDRKKIVKTHITHLTKAIEVQPCTHQEKITLLQKIGNLKNEINMMEDKIEHAKRIKFEFDSKLQEEMSKLQDKVIDWNRSLMEVSIKKPQLKKLLLKETGFHNADYLKDINIVVSLQIDIENDVAKQLEIVYGKMKQQNTIKEKIEHEIEEMNIIVNRLSEQILHLKKSSEKIVLEMKNIMVYYEDKKTSIKCEINRLEDKNDYELLIQQASDLKVHKEALNSEITKFGEKTLSFFIDLDKQVTHNITDMNSVLESVNKKLENTALESLNKNLEILGELKSLNDFSDVDKFLQH